MTRQTPAEAPDFERWLFWLRWPGIRQRSPDASLRRVRHA
jgi:hypothetical protein